MKKCPKTMSGKHLFMPMFMGWLDGNSKEWRMAQTWKIHGVDNPQECIACGIIDDLDRKETTP